MSFPVQGTIEYKTGRYPTIMDMEKHLNEIANSKNPHAVCWRLHSFTIDGRDGSVVVVLYR